MKTSDRTTIASLLAASAGEAELVRGDAQAPVPAVQLDSRAVRPGDLFVAVQGFREDGTRYLGAARAAGAAAFAVEKDRAADVAREHPDAIAALRGLTGTIDADRMRRMNLAVDQDGRSPEAVASEFVQGQGANVKSQR